MRELLEKIEKLPAGAQRILKSIVDAASQESSFDFSENKHWLVSKEFYSAFGIRLAMYHAVTKCPVNKKAFEILLYESCLELGMNTSMPDSLTADVDLLIDKKNISLKSEGRIHENVHISKFCELGKGRWEIAQDLYYKIHRKSPTDNEKTFESRIDLYDCVFVLRNSREGSLVRYELAEIPVAVFRRILDIPEESYATGMEQSSSRTIPKSFRIKVPSSDEKNAPQIIVNFDGGSERKLTITIPKVVCPTLAEWSFHL